MAHGWHVRFQGKLHFQDIQLTIICVEFLKILYSTCTYRYGLRFHSSILYLLGCYLLSSQKKMRKADILFSVQAGVIHIRVFEWEGIIKGIRLWGQSRNKLLQAASLAPASTYLAQVQVPHSLHLKEKRLGRKRWDEINILPNSNNFWRYEAVYREDVSEYPRPKA